ncbi:hypothetical protein CSQ96_06515 [Janthinobacterium sp. BJB412]|nr:hypothetical protein CSQ96_06515 [Janthinobacterium sp. BJB412]
MVHPQVQVLGVEIGSSSSQQVRAQLAKQTKVHDVGINMYTGGVQFKTDGVGYGIDNLSEVVYVFDREEKLGAVFMRFEKQRFDEIFSFLAGKYKVVGKTRPFVGDKAAQFKAKGVTILLIAPHLSFAMDALYIRDDMYQRFNVQTEQEMREKQSIEKSKF